MNIIPDRHDTITALMTISILITVLFILPPIIEDHIDSVYTSNEITTVTIFYNGTYHSTVPITPGYDLFINVPYDSEIAFHNDEYEFSYEIKDDGLHYCGSVKRLSD